MKYLVALACAAVSASALAEDVWVTRPALDIREGKGNAYNVVASVKKGDKLTVVAREDKWVRVSFNGKEGYVYENSLSPKEVPHDSMSNMSAETKALTTDAAAKGLEPEALKYSKDHNLSDAGLEKMKLMRKAITGADFETFTKDGNVGPAKH